MNFIELGQVSVTIHGVSLPTNVLMNITSIMKVTPGPYGTTVVTLNDGEKINVEDTYDNLKHALRKR